MERLAFTGRVPPSGNAEVGVRSVPDSAADDGRGTQTVVAAEVDAREERDVLAFRVLLAFTVVLFFRPQDSLPFLEPLHLANLTGTFAILALIGGRLARGASLTRVTPELVLVLALG